jgi:hypothetical protein
VRSRGISGITCYDNPLGIFFVITIETYKNTWSSCFCIGFYTSLILFPSIMRHYQNWITVLQYKHPKMYIRFILTINRCHFCDLLLHRSIKRTLFDLHCVHLLLFQPIFGMVSGAIWGYFRLFELSLFWNPLILMNIMFRGLKVWKLPVCHCLLISLPTS